MSDSGMLPRVRQQIGGPSTSGWQAFPLLGGFLRVVVGVVGAVEDVRGHATDLLDHQIHQNPRLDFGCCLGVEKDAVLMAAADSTVALERVDRFRVDRFPCQHGMVIIIIYVPGSPGNQIGRVRLGTWVITKSKHPAGGASLVVDHRPDRKRAPAAGFYPVGVGNRGMRRKR